MKNNKLVKTFLELVKIPSPSGDEGKVAMYLTNVLKKSVDKMWSDEKGNLYAYLEAKDSQQTLAFSAHIDTVQKPGEMVVPIIENDVIKSDGKTILGADNKAGVAILVELAKSIQKEKLKHNILLFFPVNEEAGIMGSSAFKFDGPKIKYFFNLDSSDKPGKFIYKSLGYENFKIVIEGLSAHAAKSYEKGIDAMVAQAKLISKLPIGKNMAEGYTMNIGKINGGFGTNVVCDKVVLEGEIRGFFKKNMEKVEKKVANICKEVAKISQTKIKFEIDEGSFIPPFMGAADGALIELCQNVSQILGVDFEVEEAYSTSDANFFSSFGYPTISVSRGGSGAHSVNEEIKISDFEMAMKMVLKLVYLA